MIVVLFLNYLQRNMNSRTRGNSFKLKFESSEYNLRKYSFTVRVVKVWNSLPDTLVNVESVYAFENGLDNVREIEIHPPSKQINIVKF